jgi:hypothetical protein
MAANNTVKMWMTDFIFFSRSSRWREMGSLGIVIMVFEWLRVEERDAIEMGEVE